MDWVCYSKKAFLSYIITIILAEQNVAEKESGWRHNHVCPRKLDFFFFLQLKSGMGNWFDTDNVIFFLTRITFKCVYCCGVYFDSVFITITIKVTSSFTALIAFNFQQWQRRGASLKKVCGCRPQSRLKGVRRSLGGRLVTE